MTLILSGTNGLSDVDGSAATPAIRGTDTNTGMFFPAADTVGITTGGTERARVDSSGNLGLGVTPSAWGSPFKAIQSGNGGSAVGFQTNANVMRLFVNNYYNGTNYVYTGSAAASQYTCNSDGSFNWQIAGSGTAGNAISFTQAMTLDASGNLGIGTTSPSTRLHVAGGAGTEVRVTSSASLADGTGSAIVRFGGSNSATSGYVGYGGTANDYYAWNALSGNMIFGTANLERARIDSSGNLLVGQTSVGTVSGYGFSLNPSIGAQAISHSSAATSGATYMAFAWSGNGVGSITQNGTTGVLYNITSDYRLKNNPTPVTGAKEFVMALQPKTWDWWDGSGKGVGFIAHEFMKVAKYSGNGEKDAVDENGNPVYQSIQPSSSEVMANLVSLLQEQQAIITQLQADVAALKGQA